MDCLSRRKFLNLTALGLMPLGIGHLALSACSRTQVLEVYMSPSCGCCGKWVDHMRNAGFQVVVTDMTDLRPIKNKFGVISKKSKKYIEDCFNIGIDIMNKGYGHILINGPISKKHFLKKKYLLENCSLLKHFR